MGKTGVYLEGLFPSRHKKLCQVTMVLDTGNLNQSVMSYKCAKDLGLNIQTSSRTATGVDGTDINIIGEVGPIQFHIEQPCKKVFTERFIIIDKMSIPINLSCEFMMRYSFECKHSPKGNVVCIDNHELPLKDQGENVNLISQLNKQLNNEYTFQENTAAELPGLHHNQEIPVVELGPQKVGLFCNETILIPAATTITMEALCPVSNLTEESGLGYVAPRSLGKRNVIMIEGIVPCNSSTFKVNMSNFEEHPVTIQKGAKIGFIWKASKITDKAKKSDKLTAMQKIDRIKFIKEKLNITSNPLIEGEADQRKLISLFLDNFDCISTSTNDIGTTDLHKFDLKLVPGTTPFRCKPIKVNPDSEKALNLQIDKWLNQGVIKEGDSPWSHPIFAVKKKAANTGESNLRWVLDFRRLNNVTERLAAPIPNISDSLERLGNSKIYTVLDLTSAYHAMPMTDEAGRATAFCTKQKQYIFLRMPFGLTNAPASFCQLMSKVYELNPELAKFSLSYLDDIILHSNTVNEHFIHLRKVLECLCAAGLKLNIGKCNLFSEEVKFLGHKISGQGISMDQDYLTKISEWPLPITGKDIQRYLGFINYYSTYFQNFAKVTQPLNALRNLKKIEWTDDLINSFKETKDLFCQQVRKAYPDWNEGIFILDTDFSNKAFGVILSQIQNGKEVMINCTSKVCNEAETNYPSWKGELCALIHACKRYTHILRYKPFLVRTDSTCLQTYKTWSKLDISGVAIRWLLYLQSFDFNIIYRPGKQHINADYLSRDMLAEGIISTDIESIEGDNNLVDQIYNLNFCVKSKRATAVYELKQRLQAQHWTAYTEKDEILRQVRDLVLKNTPPNTALLQTLPYRAKQILKYFDNLKIVDGMVVFSQPTATGRNIDRVCVPIGLYNEVYSYAHSLRSAGHKGVTETVHRINRHFFMPYLQKYVEFCISNCLSCLNRKSKPKHNHTLDRSTYSGEVLETVYIDHIGPITASRYKGKTCTHILILVDACSRFTFAYPAPDCTTSTVVNILAEDFVPKHGLFKTIVSDRGSAFTANIYNSLMDKLGIVKYHIPVRNPGSNFQERYNQGLIKYLKTDCTFEPKNWPKKLDYATLCANTSFNRRLGTTPFFAFHGRDPILPIDLFNPLSNKLDDVGHNGFLKVIERIEEGWKMLKDNTNNYLRIQNLHRQDKPLAVNTICYYFFNVVKVGLSKKLQSFFLGPMIITKRYSNSLYQINPLDSCPIKTKKPLVVARDKIYPLETRLELCPNEYIELDLKPSEIVHPDDSILLDKQLFSNIDSFSGVNEQHLDEQHLVLESDKNTQSQRTTSVETSELGSVKEIPTESNNEQVPTLIVNSEIPKSPSSHSLDLNSRSSQKGEGELLNSASHNSLPRSKSSKSSSSDNSDMSISSASDLQRQHMTVVKSPMATTSLGKRGRGRPLGSFKNRNLVPSRRSKRVVPRVEVKSRVEKRSIKDTVKEMLATRRTNSRTKTIDMSRNSRPGSRTENE